MSEKPSELPSNSGKTEIPKPAKPRAASKGKRLLALLLDFILALLLMNTLDQFFRSEDWDLKMQTPGVEKMLIFYGGVIILMVMIQLHIMVQQVVQVPMEILQVFGIQNVILGQLLMEELVLL